jgi:hypothetical protein
MRDCDAPTARFALCVLRNWLHPAKHGSWHMSFQATMWAWRQEDISSTQKLVLLDICDRGNARNQCWPKQRTIAKRVRLTERAVCTALAALQQRGLIRRLPRIKFGRRTSDLITILVVLDKPEAAPVACDAQPKPPQPSDASISLPTENGSDDRQNDVPSDTRTTFSVISNTEPPRLDLARYPILLELMPQSGRPDIDEHNAAVWFVERLRPQIAADVDWSASGIGNGTLVIDWLSRYGAGAVAATITATVARRRQIRPDDKIQSWSYFESEFAKLETRDSRVSGSGLVADTA